MKLFNLRFICVLSAGLACGCDDGPDRGAIAIAEATSSTTQAARPTTQELLDGELVRYPLKSMPFVISAPASWSVKQVPGAGYLVLSGPTPAGDVTMQLARRTPFTESFRDDLIAGATRAHNNDPKTFQIAEVRQLAGFPVLQTRTISKTSTEPALDSSGNIIAPTSTACDWKFTAFVPEAKSYIIYEIAFVDFTQEQYEKDKLLLDRIIATLEYDPKALQPSN